MPPLISEIDAFLTAHGMTEARFGIDALGDKNFVPQLRAGRDIRLSTDRRVRDFMAAYRAAA
jgi:hypothetical protein